MGKGERAAHAKAAQNRLYDSMDENLGLKNPTKKQEEEKKKREESKKTPELCSNCRFKGNMCWTSKIRLDGPTFMCSTKKEEA